MKMYAIVKELSYEVIDILVMLKLQQKMTRRHLTSYYEGEYVICVDSEPMRKDMCQFENMERSIMIDFKRKLSNDNIWDLR